MAQPRENIGRKRIRVVIIGGGSAGIAAAWELAKSPRYEVSVYERSWRLGGKGASGRASDGRIIEHGLHVWLGFYDNAFRIIRDCYEEVQHRAWGPRAELGKRLAHGSFDDAFQPEPHIGVTGLDPSGRQTVWSGLLPPAKGLPGDPIDADTNPFTVASYLQRCAELLKVLLQSVVARADENVPGQARPESRSAVDEAVDLDFSLDPTTSPELLIGRLGRRLRDGTLTAAAALLQAVTIFENVLQDLNHSPQLAGSALNFMKALAAQVRKQLHELVQIDPKLRWKTEVIDIVMTIAFGLFRDRVLLDRRGLDTLNQLDYREWLRKHGATKTALQSRFISGIYDLVFAYEGGNRRKPKLAAGVALRGAMRMFFTYRGSMFWRMRSGMGDAVFAPLYKVLRDQARQGANPVRFHFLHELKSVTLELDRRKDPYVKRMTFNMRGDDTDLDALDTFGCWAERLDDSPLAERAKGGEVPTSLEAGTHFDAVIFAMGLPDLAAVLTGPYVPASWEKVLAEADRRTVATKAAQVWLPNSLEELGWFRGSGFISALGLPFDTWADMTHTLSSERRWREHRVHPDAGAQGEPAAEARSVAYFCGVIPPEQIARLSRGAVGELEKDVQETLRGMEALWPATQAPSGAGLRALKTVTRANTTGSDRYATSLPGTIADRISPLSDALINATVAGDWTACGLDAGCVEAAVMSGRLAAHAITGSRPKLADIIGFDHP
jgi:uncharacterized protein with NAD-binding domain and iron-sulfur cluster